MATMKTSPGLVSFFVFNSDFGPKEGTEHQKIIIYIPTEEDVDKKIRNIGLSEAIIKFTETFNPEKPCEAVHTQKTRQTFYQPEPGYWMVMTISVPFSEKIAKDGKKSDEYHDEDVLDSILDAVLKQAYKMFRLFNGTFSYLVKTYGIDVLRKRAQFFFVHYLQTLNFNNFDLLDVFSGIQFLPLDKNTFLKVQSFVNLVEHTFHPIKYTAFLYSDKLVWSGLGQEDMRIMFKYLVTSLFPSTVDSEVSDSSKASQGYVVVQPKSHHGRFITGPSELNDIPMPRKPPHIFVNTDTKQEELLLVCYKALDATICLLVAAPPNPSLEFYRKLDGFVGPQLTNLANIIGEQTAKKQLGSEQQYRYIYFNHMNLAQKSSIHSKKSSLSGVAPEIIRLIGDISGDFKNFQEDGETYVKTMSDCWVVGRKSDQREFFVILNQKSANLIEINGKCMQAILSDTSIDGKSENKLNHYVMLVRFGYVIFNYQNFFPTFSLPFSNNGPKCTNLFSHFRPRGNPNRFDLLFNNGLRSLTKNLRKFQSLSLFTHLHTRPKENFVAVKINV